MRDMNYYDEKEIEQELDNDIRTGIVSKNGPAIVYELPDEDSEVVCVLEPGSEVEIDVDYLPWKMKFLKIYTPFGQEGYCMKRFIKA